MLLAVVDVLSSGSGDQLWQLFVVFFDVQLKQLAV